MLEEELRAILNRASRENKSDTPDFILSNFMMKCLETYEQTVKERDQWFGIDPWNPPVGGDAK